MKREVKRLAELQETRVVVISERASNQINDAVVNWAMGHYEKGMTREKFEDALMSDLPFALKKAPWWIHWLVDAIWDLFTRDEK